MRTPEIGVTLAPNTGCTVQDATKIQDLYKKGNKYIRSYNSIPSLPMQWILPSFGYLFGASSEFCISFIACRWRKNSVTDILFYRRGLFMFGPFIYQGRSMVPLECIR
jgi:hypothetical protein